MLPTKDQCSPGLASGLLRCPEIIAEQAIAGLIELLEWKDAIAQFCDCFGEQAEVLPETPVPRLTLEIHHGFITEEGGEGSEPADRATHRVRQVGVFRFQGMGVNEGGDSDSAGMDSLLEEFAPSACDPGGRRELLDGSESIVHRVVGQPLGVSRGSFTKQTRNQSEIAVMRQGENAGSLRAAVSCKEPLTLKQL